MKYQLKGEFLQCLEITLEPGERCFAKRGSLVCMDSGITQSVRMNGRSVTGVLGAKLSGESLFLVEYVNTSRTAGSIVLSAGQSTIAALSLTEGHKLVVRRSDYISSSDSVDLNLHLSFNKMVKGTVPAFQLIRGNATVFVSYQGNLIKKELQEGEEITVDEGCIKMLYDIPDKQIRWQKRFNILRNIFTGEGLLLTRIVGPGTAYLSSVPYRDKTRHQL
jgi:TIGR00266 family protein